MGTQSKKEVMVIHSLFYMFIILSALIQAVNSALYFKATTNRPAIILSLENIMSWL